MTINKVSSKLRGGRTWKVTSAPAVEPITVIELKTFARIDGTDEDTLLEGFIEAARQAIETYLGRVLITQTIEVLMDEWPGKEIELPLPPLISITGIYTLSEADVATTYDSDNYYTVSNSIPGKVVIKNGASRPYNSDRQTAGYKIVYTAGYGATSASVPSQIKEALKLWATAIYENRALTKEPPPEARTLLDLYRVIKY